MLIHIHCINTEHTKNEYNVVTQTAFYSVTDIKLNKHILNIHLTGYEYMIFPTQLELEVIGQYVPIVLQTMNNISIKKYGSDALCSLCQNDLYIDNQISCCYNLDCNQTNNNTSIYLRNKLEVFDPTISLQNVDDIIQQMTLDRIPISLNNMINFLLHHHSMEDLDHKLQNLSLTQFLQMVLPENPQQFIIPFSNQYDNSINKLMKDDVYKNITQDNVHDRRNLMIANILQVNRQFLNRVVSLGY